VGLKERNDFERLGVNGRMILRRISKKYDWMAWIRRVVLRRTGAQVGCCESGNEHSVSIKYGDFIDWL
jgi:uncharacterized membrane protein